MLQLLQALFVRGRHSYISTIVATQKSDAELMQLHALYLAT